MTGEVMFSLQAQSNPRVGGAVKAALLVTALVFAGASAVLPQFGVKEPIAAYALLGIAALDAALAFILAPVIEKQTAGVMFRFFSDRLDISVAGRAFSLPYENIRDIEDAGSARLSENGLTNIRITTHRPPRIPFFGIGNTIVLASLAQADSPFARIKEVVEKSRRA